MLGLVGANQPKEFMTYDLVRGKAFAYGARV